MSNPNETTEEKETQQLQGSINLSLPTTMTKRVSEPPKHKVGV